MEEVAGQIGLSRQFVGDIERGGTRATPSQQQNLASLYGLTVDELFEPATDRHFAVADDGEWCTASAVEEILDLTGEGVCNLVEGDVLQRRGGASRRQFHRPSVEALVPPGSVKISRLLVHLEQFAIGLEVRPFPREQLRRRRAAGELSAFQPWPGAEWRFPPEEVKRLEDELKQEAHRERTAARLRRTPAGQVPPQLTAWTGSPKHAAVLKAGRETLFAQRAKALEGIEEELRRRRLHDREETARLLDVDGRTLTYYMDVGLLTGERVEVDHWARWGFSAQAIAEHRLTFAKRLPPPDERGEDGNKLGRHGIFLVEDNYVANAVAKGQIEEESAEEGAARSRVKRRRKEILPRKARVTVAASRGGQHKGEKEAQEARRLALAAITARPGLSKRNVIDSVIVQLFGVDAVADVVDGKKVRRGSRDRKYRLAREKVDTRLARSFKDECVPAELAHLFGP